MIVVRLQEAINIPAAEYRQLRDVVTKLGGNWTAVQGEIAEAAHEAAVEAVEAAVRRILDGCGTSNE